VIRVYFSGGLLGNPQGALQSLLNVMADRAGPELALVACVVVTALGALVLSNLVREASHNGAVAFIVLSIIVLGMQLTIVPQVWERYWMPAVPLVILGSYVVAERNRSPRWLILAQAGYLLVLGTAYLLWQLRN
jgi:hypothetical protein